MEEKIKQNEGSRSETAPDKVKVLPSPKKNKVFTLIKEMWPAYLIEVLVIILGISVTLAMEKWRDNSKEAVLEKIYQKNLLLDIAVDKNYLAYAITNTKELLDKGNDLLTYLKSPKIKKFSPNQIQTALQAILGRPNFRSSDATFSDLKNSGNIHLIKDIQLRNFLFAYYSEAQHIKDLQAAEQLATINISGPFFLKRFSLEDTLYNQNTTSTINTEDLPKSIEFTNNVFLRVLNRQELLKEYENADSLSTQLKNELLAE